MLCAACNKEFENPTGRKTCSRSCAVALAWRDPEARARRIAGISAEKKTAEAQERLRLHNERRWAKPEEHEKLSAWNRARWADPTIKAALSAAIKAAQAIPEVREKFSAARRRAWQNLETRKRMIAGMIRGHGTPEARIKFSLLLKARWQDPVLRPKYLAGVRATAAKYKGVPRKGLSIMLMAAPAVQTRPQTQAALAEQRNAAKWSSIRRRRLASKVKPMSLEETRKLIAKSGVIVKRYPTGVPLGWKPSWMS